MKFLIMTICLSSLLSFAGKKLSPSETIEAIETNYSVSCEKIRDSFAACMMERCFYSSFYSCSSETEFFPVELAIKSRKTGPARAKVRKVIPKLDLD